MNAFEFLLGSGVLAEHGDRIALMCGDENATYRQLVRSVERASGALASLGVRAGDRVLMLMRDTPEFVAAWLGAVRAGAVAVSVNPRLSEVEQRHIIADSGARVSIVESSYADARPLLAEHLAQVGRLAVVGEGHGRFQQWRELIQAAPQLPAAEVASDSPAF